MAVTKWWEALLNEEANGEAKEEAVKLDKSRRYVDHYFNTLKELKRAGLISYEYYENLTSAITEKEFWNMIESMSRKFNDEKWPIVPLLPEKDC